MRLQRLLWLAALATLAPAAAFAQFNQATIISTSMGGIVSGTYGYFKYVSATYGLGGGSGTSDRIVSGTTGLTAISNTKTISITNNNVVTGYFNSNGVLTVPGISATSNLTSVTTLYASGNVGVKTATPAASLSVSGSIQLSTDNVSCTTTLKGALQYTNQTLQVCDGSNWTSVASFPGTVPTTPGSGGIGYMVVTSGTFNGNLGGLSGANTKCYNDLNAYAWMGKPGTLNSAKVTAFLCNKTTCNGLIANTTYYYANAGNSTVGGAFFTTDANGIGPGDSFQWDGSNRFGGSYSYWSNRDYGSNDTVFAANSAGTDNFSSCSNWAVGSNSSSAWIGSTPYINANRWRASQITCDTLLNLICIVNP